jgi:hypothetical protein
MHLHVCMYACGSAFRWDYIHRFAWADNGTVAPYVRVGLELIIEDKPTEFLWIANALLRSQI